MNGIHLGRVVLGGLVAGLVLNASELVIGIFTGEYWQRVMEQLAIPAPGSAQGIAILVIGFVTGIALVWVYAAMRPRFGGGFRTAAIAALSVWSIAWLLPHLSYLALGLFPVPLLLIEIAGAAIKYVLATAAGAWVYRESDTPGRERPA